MSSSRSEFEEGDFIFDRRNSRTGEVLYVIGGAPVLYTITLANGAVCQVWHKDARMASPSEVESFKARREEAREKEAARIAAWERGRRGD